MLALVAAGQGQDPAGRDQRCVDPANACRPLALRFFEGLSRTRAAEKGQ
jgi:hypothetical protein